MPLVVNLMKDSNLEVRTLATLAVTRAAQSEPDSVSLGNTPLIENSNHPVKVVSYFALKALTSLTKQQYSKVTKDILIQGVLHSSFYIRRLCLVCLAQLCIEKRIELDKEVEELFQVKSEQKADTLVIALGILVCSSDGGRPERAA